MNQIDYSLDPIEVIIRLTPDDVIEFNKLNDFSIDQIKADLSGKELYCHFQKISDTEHKIFIPTLNGHFEAIVKWYSVADTYQAVVDKKKKTIYRPAIIKPQADKSISETCFVKIIDINEGGKANRASDEFEELYLNVCRQPIVSNINIENQQEIWFKWIEAQKAIIDNLQKPYQVKGIPSIQETKNSNNEVTRNTIKFDLANEVLPEYEQLDKKLKEYDINCSFNADGTTELTKDDIERVLDEILRLDFSEKLERSKYLSAIIRIKKRLDLEINKYLNLINWNASSTLDYDSGLLIISNSSTKDILLPKELIERYRLVKNGLIGTLTKKNSKGKIEKESIVVNLWTGVYGKIVEENKNKLKKELLEKRQKAFDLGYTNVRFEIGELYSYDINLFDNQSFDDDFWKDLKRDLIAYDGVISFNEYSQTIDIEFDSFEKLKELSDFLRRLNKFQFALSPLNPSFKFKVKTNVIAKKSEKELFLEKIKLLKGAEFVVEVAKEGSKRNELIYLGKLNGNESDIQKLVLNVPNIFPDDKKKSKDVVKFLNSEKKPIIKEIRANLTGDATKIGWLQNAIKKITQPTDAPNGKAANEKLGEFIFDTSNATPIYDEAKVMENSEYYWEVRNNELLKLNVAQRKAVLAAIHCSDLALLQGPPGTGKTTVIAEIIWQIISKNPKHRILLTSETNLAVDNALDRLLNTKGVNPNLAKYTTLIKPLRFGRMGKMDEEGAKYSVDRIMKWLDETYQIPQEYEPDTLDEKDEELDDDVQKNSLENNAVQDWMERIASRAKNNNPKYGEALKHWANELTNQPTKEVKQIFKDKYFEYANIVGSTCSSSGSPRFMWDAAKVFSNQNIDTLNKLNYQAQNAPFGREFENQLNALDISTDIKSQFKGLIQNYYADGKIVKSVFNKDKSEITDKDLEKVDALETIGKSKIRTEKDTNKLVSYHNVTDFGKQYIAPYFEPKVQFDTVIMDEASKATPPELVLPLCFAKRSIVIGDHRQLPPMLNEKDFREALQEADAGHLADEIDREFTETSQFERMILNPKVSPTIISRCNIQYRMHPDINKVIKQFYLDEGGLEPAQELIENADDHNLNNIFSRHHGLFYQDFIDANIHTIWVNVQTPELREGTSVSNEGEVKAIRMVIEMLKKTEGFEAFQNHWNFIKDDFKSKQEKEIGVISFYGAQKRLIKRSLAGVGVPLKINTVDRFQGMERNIIIVSTVRSNTQTVFGGKTKPNQDSGFAKSPQRLNVALSRGKRLLIVVGNKYFFEQVTDKTGKPLYKNAIAEMTKVIDFETLQNQFKK